MSTKLTSFEEDASKQELQESILSYKKTLQRLGKKYEEMLLNTFPYLGRNKSHKHEIKFCVFCQEEHYLSNGDCNECGRFLLDPYGSDE